MHLCKEGCGCGRDHKMDIVGLYVWVWLSRGGRGGDPCCVMLRVVSFQRNCVNRENKTDVCAMLCKGVL